MAAKIIKHRIPNTSGQQDFKLTVPLGTKVIGVELEYEQASVLTVAQAKPMPTLWPYIYALEDEDEKTLVDLDMYVVKFNEDLPLPVDQLEHVGTCTMHLPPHTLSLFVFQKK